MVTQSKQTNPLAQALGRVSLFMLWLWIIWASAWAWSVDLSPLGIEPRTLSGLVGVLFAPLVHGSAAHLAGNSIGLLILGTALWYGYPNSRWWVLGLVWLLGGIGVWLFARPSVHFGASGLTHGVFFYLFLISILRRDKRSIALMMIAFFMFGGMIYSVFPREPGISYESHLAGALVGLACAVAFRRWDPMPQETRYQWEGEEDEDDLIGDEWQQGGARSMGAEVLRFPIDPETPGRLEQRGPPSSDRRL
ncbi:rhomboid family intramembrane serine protease [Ferrimonas marina]|uniref:Membrane associated serine protease, rhomboid family n=1 Tax=Ferrimonas marina TaxID=299255 RepID=A0A1M5NVT7_9GAMM|nr:rhomboid family intramembrane serine protease [Ferrimonas marina]SHG93565.1 Membrane associated serine protease, rhomboid family [Ferrimonas marina]